MYRFISLIGSQNNPKREKKSKKSKKSNIEVIIVFEMEKLLIKIVLR